MSALACRHGNYSDTGRRRDLPASVEAKAAKHERKCAGEVFVHPGTVIGLFDVACCNGCGRRIA